MGRNRESTFSWTASTAINQLLILSSGNFYSISEFVNSGSKVSYNFPIKLRVPRVRIIELSNFDIDVHYYLQYLILREGAYWCILFLENGYQHINNQSEHSILTWFLHLKFGPLSAMIFIDRHRCQNWRALAYMFNASQLSELVGVTPDKDSCSPRQSGVTLGLPRGRPDQGSRLLSNSLGFIISQMTLH